MLRNKLVRSDGSLIDSSVIISCDFTEEVNCNTNLAFGDVTSSELTVVIRSTEAIQQGEVLTYYMVEDGVETLIGEFIAEKPTVVSRTSIRFSAYDNISKTEKSFAGWLREHQDLFPMTPMDLLTHACSYCGVAYAGGDFPNQSISINAFYADEITCRNVLSWIAALAGRFVRANAVGEIEFAQYSRNSDTRISYKKGYINPVNLVVTDTYGNVEITGDSMVVTDDGAGNVIAMIDRVTVMDVDGHVTLIMGTEIPYLQGTLSYETYWTDKIERVQIKHSDDDVGVIYPATATGNCYSISQNMLLGACSTEDVELVAQTLYELLGSITYVPFRVTLPRTAKIRAGDIIEVEDVDGNIFSTIVMKMSITASGVNLTTTGDKSYNSTAAVASEKFSNLTGKVMSIKKSIDGLEIKNEDLKGSVSSIKVTTDTIETKVTGVEKDLKETQGSVSDLNTSFKQTKSDFEWKFEKTTGDIDVLKEESKTQASYIRFVDGNIHLGRSDSSLTLIIKNDRMSFFNGSKEVAYVSENKLYITDGEFLANLYIGKFGLTPRNDSTGNLSFRKVKN